MLLCVTRFTLVIDAERRAGSAEHGGGGGDRGWAVDDGLIIG
jgi:hypothetical protein